MDNVAQISITDFNGDIDTLNLLTKKKENIAVILYTLKKTKLSKTIYPISMNNIHH